MAQKNGLVKVYDSLDDPTPTVLADLRTQVDDYWDRGLLGLALPPGFPISDPRVRAVHVRRVDRRYGAGLERRLPPPPAPTTDGCVVSGRLSRLTAVRRRHDRRRAGPDQRLVPAVPEPLDRRPAFGPTACSTSAAATARASTPDYGPVRRSPRAHPRTPAATRPAARRRDEAADAPRAARCAPELPPPGEPVRPERQHPAHRPGHRRRSSGKPARRRERRKRPPHDRGRAAQPVPVHLPAWDQRALGRGRRMGHLGGDRPASPTPTAARRPNFGWPCIEGPRAPDRLRRARTSAICNTCTRRARRTTRSPYYCVQPHDTRRGRERHLPDAAARRSRGSRSTREAPTRRPTTARCSSPTTRASASGSMRKGADGLPTPRTSSRSCCPLPIPSTSSRSRTATSTTSTWGTSTRRAARSIGSGDFAANQPPLAVATATPSSGASPLTVQLDARGSAIQIRATRSATPGTSTATAPSGTPRASRPPHLRRRGRLRRARPGDRQPRCLDRLRAGASLGGQTPPVPHMDSPSASLTWKVGVPISFSGHASDAEEGTLPTSDLSWRSSCTTASRSTTATSTRSRRPAWRAASSARRTTVPVLPRLQLDEPTDARGLSASTT